jgi:hypothetical protein
MGTDMKTSEEVNDLHDNFKRLVHAIESNKKYYKIMTNASGFPCQFGLILKRVIDYQELLLKKFAVEMSAQSRGTLDHKSDEVI